MNTPQFIHSHTDEHVWFGTIMNSHTAINILFHDFCYPPIMGVSVLLAGAVNNQRSAS